MSSTIHISVGQCGNTIAGDFWSLVLADKHARKSFCDEHGRARAVFVDTDSKVVKKIGYLINQQDKTPNHRSQTVPADMQIAEEGGRGNNWAMGYYYLGDSGRHSLAARSMEAIRRQAERCDWFAQCILSHSVAGGTGSGLGCRILDGIRVLYPKVMVMSNTVVPWSHGETPMQSYNALFTLARLQELSDAIVLHENEAICTGIDEGLSGRKARTPRASASMGDINKYIAASMAGVMFPVHTADGLVRRFDIANVTSTVCPMGEEKLLGVRTAPFPALSKQQAANEDYRQVWAGIVGNLSNWGSTYDAESASLSEYSSSHAWVRGCNPFEWGNISETIDKKIQRKFPHASWNKPNPIFYTTSHPPLRKGMSSPQSITLLSNGMNSLRTLERVYRLARSMYMSGAYTQWYSKYGCGHEEFANAFEILRGPIESYRKSHNEVITKCRKISENMAGRDGVEDIYSDGSFESDESA